MWCRQNSTLNDCSFQTICNPQHVNEISTWWWLQHYCPEKTPAPHSAMSISISTAFTHRVPHCQYHLAVEGSWSPFWSQLKGLWRHQRQMCTYWGSLWGGGEQEKNKAVPPDDSNVCHDICCQEAVSFKATSGHSFLFCFILMIYICFTSEYTTSDLPIAQVF